MYSVLIVTEINNLQWPWMAIARSILLYVRLTESKCPTVRWSKSAPFISLKTKIVVYLYVLRKAFQFQLILMTFNNVEWTFELKLLHMITRTGILSSGHML